MFEVTPVYIRQMSRDRGYSENRGKVTGLTYSPKKVSCRKLSHFQKMAALCFHKFTYDLRHGFSTHSELCYVDCYTSRKLPCEVPNVTSRTWFLLTNVQVGQEVVPCPYGLSLWNRIKWSAWFPETKLSWPYWAGIIPEPQKCGSPSTISPRSSQASSRFSSSRTLRNTNFANFSPYKGVCVNYRPYGLPVPI